MISFLLFFLRLILTGFSLLNRDEDGARVLRGSGGVTATTVVVCEGEDGATAPMEVVTAVKAMADGIAKIKVGKLRVQSYSLVFAICS